MRTNKLFLAALLVAVGACSDETTTDGDTGTGTDTGTGDTQAETGSESGSGGSAEESTTESGDASSGDGTGDSSSSGSDSSGSDSSGSSSSGVVDTEGDTEGEDGGTTGAIGTCMTPNDNLACDDVVLGCGESFSLVDSTDGERSSKFFGECTGTSGYPQVRYSFSVAADGEYDVALDPAFAVGNRSLAWEILTVDTSCRIHQTVTCGHDISAFGLQDSPTATLEAGRTYLLLVEGWDWSAGQGVDFGIDITAR